jgi:hypothetical protein
MKNGPFKDDSATKKMICHSYAKLPEVNINK